MKKLVAFLVLALAALALAACGSSSSNSTTTSGGENESTESQAEQGGPPKEASSEGGGSTLKFEADPNGQLAFTTNHMTAKAGKVTIDFTNPQSLSHDLVIENSSGKEIARVEPITDGSNSTTADLKPGTYHYFCSIPGHREAGMEGVLEVE